MDPFENGLLVIFPSSCGVIEETSMEITGIHHIVLSLYKLTNERNCSPSTFEIFKRFMDSWQPARNFWSIIFHFSAPW